MPRLFLDHFYSTSFIAEVDGSGVAFLIGFLSPSEPLAAYIHFVGVDPTHRGRTWARRLYEEFFALARADGWAEVTAITSPENAGSIAFHRRMGFQVTEPIDGYNRTGVSHVVFTRAI